MATKNDGVKRTPEKQEILDKPLPKISVITVTYNRLNDLRKTFSSVTSQTYSNVEYIIIDGASKDGTVDFLRENDKLISFWVSENDNGIYDAMNKGASVATGDWIIFMNSGDTFFSNETLSKVATYCNDSVDVIYGAVQVILVDKYQTRVFDCQPRNLSEIWREIPTCHQSIFIRKELQVKFSFDTSFSWCADHDLLVRLFTNGYRFEEIPTIIAKFDGSGGEIRDILTYTKERWRISKHLAKPLQRHTHFFREYLGFFIHKYIISKVRDLLPKEWVTALRKYRGTY